LIVYRATWRPAGSGEDTAPGMIVGESGDLSRLGVMAGEGTVAEVMELQPEGKRRMAAAEFLRGHRPRPGDYLGPEKAAD
jgi:methionyl-tRNA formyltransferase